MDKPPEQIAREWLLKYYPWGDPETWSGSTSEAWNRNWTMLKDFVRDCWPKETQMDTLRKIKLTTLTATNARLGFAHICRLCIDAGVTEHLEELQGAAPERKP